MSYQSLSKQNQYQHSPRIWSWILIWAHVIRGLLILSCQFPFIPQKAKIKHIQDWSIQLLKIFGVQLQLHNEAILPPTPFLLASNHISWMDIHAINAFRPIRFVAKSDVEEWPIFGWMAKQLGTVFIRRDNARQGKQIASELSKVLQTQSVCIFPEGTSTNGESVKPFKPNLFEAAVIAQVPVYSLAILYKSAMTGARSEAAAFVGDMGLLGSMAKILQERGLIVELSFLPPSGSSLEAPMDRKWLAIHSQEAISAKLKGDQRLM